MKCLVLSHGALRHASFHINSSILELCIQIYCGRSAASLCYTCFDCGRPYPDLINSVPGLALHYLCVDFISSC